MPASGSRENPSFTSWVVLVDVRTLIHTDSNNEEGSMNYVTPLSSFKKGGIWVETPGGKVAKLHKGKTLWGKVMETSGPCSFDALCKHGTEAWDGRRTMLIGYTVRGWTELAAEDQKLLDDTLGSTFCRNTGEGTVASKRGLADVEEEDPFHGRMEAARRRNRGDPLTVKWRGHLHSFVDGCGLNSPGRWRPSARGTGLPSQAVQLIEGIRRLLDEFIQQHLPDTKKLYFQLAGGRMDGAPFSEEAMTELRTSRFNLLENPVDAARVPEGQPFFLEALSQTCRALQDEDWRVLTNEKDSYASGRRVGYNMTFPRVPMVYRPKQKQRVYDESEFQAVNGNYESAREVPEQLEQQFQEEERLGFMYPLSEAEARGRFGEKLRVASLGAIQRRMGPCARSLMERVRFRLTTPLVSPTASSFPRLTISHVPWRRSGRRATIS